MANVHVRTFDNVMRGLRGCMGGEVMWQRCFITRPPNLPNVSVYVLPSIVFHLVCVFANIWDSVVCAGIIHIVLPYNKLTFINIYLC